MDRKSFIRISPDSDVLYIDSDSCCVMAYGNEICNEGPSLGPRFRECKLNCVKLQ